MDYFREVGSKSFWDAWNLVLGRSLPTSVIGLVIFICSLLLLKYSRRHEEAKLRLTEFAKAALITAAFFLIFWEFCFAFLTPKRLLTDARKNLAEKPRLRGFVTPGGGTISGEAPGGSTGIIFLFTLINSGPPTTVHGFKARLKVGNQSQIIAPSYLPEETEFFFEDEEGKTGVKIKPSEMIYNKAYTTPIPEGGRVDGFLFYVLQGIRPEDFWRQNPIITIYFFDAAGNQYETLLQNQGPQPPSYVPGVDNPFLPLITKRPTPPPSSTPGTGASPP